MSDFPHETKRKGIQEGEISIVFQACDTNKSGSLNFSELQHAFQAFGLYPSEEFLDTKMDELTLNFPLNMLEFSKLLEAMETSKCRRGLHVVPYARRGITLKQIKDVLAGVFEDRWMPSLCEKFNRNHDAEIRDPTTKIHKKFMNLYAIDEYLVRPTTSCLRNLRDGIPEPVLNAAAVPPMPVDNVSYSEMVNPYGVSVDYFVSHAWVHDYEKTVTSLKNFAESVYTDIGKSTPDDVVFWICMFALNQHKAKEEVGSTPEEGPFNAALSHAKHGAVMVLDSDAEPMKRIWCLYEVSRAKEFGKSFELIVDEGQLTKASVWSLEEISRKLLKVRASKANASNELDKLKIHYHILDPVFKRSMASFESYKLEINLRGVEEDFFKEFDTHICGLIATPLMEAGLRIESAAVCLRAIGMGAAVTKENLKYLARCLGADLKAKVETRLGTCGLINVFANSGREHELKYMLDIGADVNNKDSNNRTPLQSAARRGYLEICTILLAHGAEVGYKDGFGATALHAAAQGGHLKVCSLLISHGQDVEDKVNMGYTPLILAAMGGHEATCALLLDNGANILEKEKKGWTALIVASNSGHLETCALLMDRGATIGDKNNKGSTALHLAAQNGHLWTCRLLVGNGAEINDKNNQGRTPLHFAAYKGHLEVCAILVDCGAHIECTNNLGETPLEEAKDGGHGGNVELCTLLQSYDAEKGN